MIRLNTTQVELWKLPDDVPKDEVRERVADDKDAAFVRATRSKVRVQLHYDRKEERIIAKDVTSEELTRGYVLFDKAQLRRLKITPEKGWRIKMNGSWYQVVHILPAGTRSGVTSLLQAYFQEIHPSGMVEDVVATEAMETRVELT